MLTTQAGRLVTNGTGAAFTASSWAHDSGGIYLVGLSTSHTATVGRLRLSFSDPATYVPVWEDYAVLSAAVYDVLFGTVAPSTHAPADVRDVDNSSPASGSLGEAARNADAKAATLIGTIGAPATTVSGDIAAVGGGIAAVSGDIATVSTDIATVSTDVATVSTDVAAVATSLAAFNGLAIFGTVAASPAPTTTAFKVTLSDAISGSAVAATFVGLYAELLDGALAPSAKAVTACVVNSTTALTLTTAAFAAAPVAGSSVMIGP